jgi:hypothetical protein
LSVTSLSDDTIINLQLIVEAIRVHDQIWADLFGALGFGEYCGGVGELDKSLPFLQAKVNV